MRKILSFALLSMFIAACGTSATEKTKQETLKEAVTHYEDSLSKLQADPEKAKTITSLSQIELVNRYKAYFQAFPSDDFSDDCVFKTHMIYESMSAPREARAYADTLLARFPNYKNKVLVLESLASSYDINEPRDTAMVRKYYNLLLAEKQVPAHKKKEIKARLSKLHLSFEELILEMN